MSTGAYVVHCTDGKICKVHTEVIDAAVDATCMTSGLTEGKHCSVCGEVLVAQEIVPTTGHAMENGVCSICGYSDYLTFTQLSDGTYSVKAKDKTKIPAELVIPSTYMGKPVTAIEESGFFNCQGVTSVVVPDSVITIGASAFNYCKAIESITLPFVGASKDGTANTHFGYIFGARTYDSHESAIPASLKTVVIRGGTSIDANAFYKCKNIVNISIPDSVTTIGKLAFAYCASLESIAISPNVTTVG